MLKYKLSQIKKISKKILSNLVESLKNYDSNYWSIYYSEDFGSIHFQIGEYNIAEIGNGYVSLIVDGIFFDMKDFTVSGRYSESFHRKHSVLEESHSDFSEVSNRKFESLLRKDPNSECSHD